MSEVTTRTAAEDAALIRAEYRRLGWGRRQVSVRSHCYSLGSDIRVEIKSPEVDAARALAIAQKAERVDRDEVTGEFLCGGNRFVSLTYSKECQEVLARRHIAVVKAALQELEWREAGAVERVVGVPGATVEKTGPGQVVLLHVEGPDRTVTILVSPSPAQAEEASFRLAVALSGWPM